MSHDVSVTDVTRNVASQKMTPFPIKGNDVRKNNYTIYVENIYGPIIWSSLQARGFG